METLWNLSNGNLMKWKPSSRRSGNWNLMKIVAILLSGINSMYVCMYVWMWVSVYICFQCIYLCVNVISVMDVYVCECMDTCMCNVLSSNIYYPKKLVICMCSLKVLLLSPYAYLYHQYICMPILEMLTHWNCRLSSATVEPLLLN